MLEKVIYRRLMLEFKPTKLIIKNNSAHHASHTYLSNNCSHLHITLHSNELKDLPKIEQHRRIYACLLESFEQGLHSLSLDLDY